MREVFKEQGQQWDDSTSREVKALVARLIEASPETALNVHKRSSFDTLIRVLEERLTEIQKDK
jgi:hypothetical protein